MEVTIATFYRFVALENLDEWKKVFKQKAGELGLKGTLLVASEGINATLAGMGNSVHHFLEFLRSFPEFEDLEARLTYNQEIPFQRLKVRLKKEIITLKDPCDPRVRSGKRVLPQAWNDLISSPNTLLIDTRNEYEIEQGAFKNAVNPKLKSFSQFKDFVESHLKDSQDKPIAMYCTGGIRCEKASSYLLDHGFKEVYQLEGGIIRYQLEVPEAESLFEGKNFVFDERMVL